MTKPRGSLQDPFWLELFSAISALAWSAGSYFLDGDRGNSQAYRVTMEIFQNATWEGLGCLLAVAQVASLLLQSRTCGAVICFFMSSFWCLLGYTIYLSQNNALGVVFYGVWGFANAVSMGLLSRRVHG